LGYYSRHHRRPAVTGHWSGRALIAVGTGGGHSGLGIDRLGAADAVCDSVALPLVHARTLTQGA